VGTAVGTAGTAVGTAGTAVGTAGTAVAGGAITTSVGVGVVAQAARIILNSTMTATSIYSLLCFIFLFSFRFLKNIVSVE
jgi:hypothetical protein